VKGVERRALGWRAACLQCGSVVRGKEKREREGVGVGTSTWRWEKEGRGGPAVAVGDTG
jgi:hypothetical protein